MRKLVGIDSSSVSVSVTDVAFDAQWNDDQWHEVTGVHASTEPIVSAMWNGQSNVKFRQTLVKLNYNNFFGQEVYSVNVYLDGHHSADWKNFIIHPYVTGGGITDGGTDVSYRFAPDASTLKLSITQYFNTDMIAKRLELDFDRIGDTFVQSSNTP